MSRRSRGWTVLLLLLAIAAGSYAAWRATRGQNGLGVSAVVLITLDTVRADRLGCYGSDSGLTPSLDRLAAEGVRFERCLSTAPITLPAHASILSGTDPVAHGVRVNGAYMFDPTNPSLAEILSKNGFATAAFVSAEVLDQQYGLARGFQVYDDRKTDAAGEADPGHLERRGERTVKAALEWLDQQGSKPFFLWVHLFDAHAPYEAPAEFAERFEEPYDAEVAYVDHCVKLLLDGLDGRQRLDDALVTVVADHGEGLGDHGESTHTVFVYDTTMRVPWIVWSRGRLPANRVIRQSVSIISVASTLLELLRLETPPEMYGPSHAEWVTTAESDLASWVAAPVYFESRASSYYYGFAPLSGIELDGYKLIVAPRSELYRVMTDPGERTNLIERERSVANRLKRSLDDYEREHATQRSRPRKLDLDAQERLRELGYIASRGSSESGGGRDPKDGILIVEALQRATVLAKDDLAGAIRVLEQLVEGEPEVTEAFDILGELHSAAGNITKAVDAYERALELSPRNPDLYAKQGSLLFRLTQSEQAEQCLRMAIDLDPTHVRARVQLGLMYLSQDRLESARHLFDEVLMEHPDVVAARIGRADCVLRMNNVRLADQDLRAALAEQPRNLPVLLRLVNTSLILVNQEDALRFFVRAKEIDPSLPPPPGLELPPGDD